MTNEVQIDDILSGMREYIASLVQENAVLKATLKSYQRDVTPEGTKE